MQALTNYRQDHLKKQPTRKKIVEKDLGTFSSYFQGTGLLLEIWR